ncbi:hypothetical protein MHYP_G00322290 [Metynnis hypsauchen]
MTISTCSITTAKVGALSFPLAGGGRAALSRAGQLHTLSPQRSDSSKQGVKVSVRFLRLYNQRGFFTGVSKREAQSPVAALALTVRGSAWLQTSLLRWNFTGAPHIPENTHTDSIHAQNPSCAPQKLHFNRAWVSSSREKRSAFSHTLSMQAAPCGAQADSGRGVVAYLRLRAALPCTCCVVRGAGEEVELLGAPQRS